MSEYEDARASGDALNDKLWQCVATHFGHLDLSIDEFWVLSQILAAMLVCYFETMVERGPDMVSERAIKTAKELSKFINRAVAKGEKPLRIL